MKTRSVYALKIFLPALLCVALILTCAFAFLPVSVTALVDNEYNYIRLEKDVQMTVSKDALTYTFTLPAGYFAKVIGVSETELTLEYGSTPNAVTGTVPRSDVTESYYKLEGDLADAACIVSGTGFFTEGGAQRILYNNPTVETALTNIGTGGSITIYGRAGDKAFLINTVADGKTVFGYMPKADIRPDVYTPTASALTAIPEPLTTVGEAVLTPASPTDTKTLFTEIALGVILTVALLAVLLIILKPSKTKYPHTVKN